MIMYPRYIGALAFVHYSACHRDIISYDNEYREALLIYVISITKSPLLREYVNHGHATPHSDDMPHLAK